MLKSVCRTQICAKVYYKPRLTVYHGDTPTNPLQYVHICSRLYVHVFFINCSHITVAVNVSYTAALQTVYQYQVLTKYSHQNQ